MSLSGCRPHDFPQFPPNYREFAYVTNGASNTVSVLDVVNMRLDREVLVGQNPVAVAASALRPEVYVVNAGAAGGQGSLSIVNAENNSVAATIPLHGQPVSIDLDDAHDLAYIPNSGSNTVSVIDLKSRRETAQIGTGEQPAEARVAFLHGGWSLAQLDQCMELAVGVGVPSDGTPTDVNTHLEPNRGSLDDAAYS